MTDWLACTHIRKDGHRSQIINETLSSVIKWIFNGVMLMVLCIARESSIRDDSSTTMLLSLALLYKRGHQTSLISLSSFPLSAGEMLEPQLPFQSETFSEKWLLPLWIRLHLQKYTTSFFVSSALTRRCLPVVSQLVLYPLLSSSFSMRPAMANRFERFSMWQQGKPYRKSTLVPDDWCIRRLF